MNFPFKKTIRIGLLTLASAGTAWAQGSSPLRSPAGTTDEYRLTLTGEQPGDGIRLSDSAVLNVGVTAEAGYDTNVFYTKESRIESAILHVIPSFNLNNRARTGQSPPAFTYQLGASLLYREYLSDNTDVKAQRGFSPTAIIALEANGAKVDFSLSDTFARLEEPSYGVSAEPLRHNHNLAQIALRFSPGGGRLQDTVGYRNSLDIFDQLSYGDNMAHEVWNDLSLKWLPKTAFYLRVMGGFTHFFNDSPSMPRSDAWTVGGQVGLRGLITAKLSADIGVGYGTALFENDTQVTGAASFAGRVGLWYLPTKFTSLGLGYEHGFRISPLIGDYYDLDTAFIAFNQGLGSRLVFGIEGRYEYRVYRNFRFLMMPFDRRDHIVFGGAKLDFFIQKWFYAGIGYSVSFDESNLDMAQANVVGVDYTKHLILGRVGITY